MRVRFVDNIEGSNTPARVNRMTGEIILNRSRWDKIPDEYKKFILLHEAGHYKLQTKNELLADKYAFQHFAGTEPMSLKNSVKSISQILPFTRQEHFDRFNSISKQALIFDAENNNNLKAKEMITNNDKLSFMDTEENYSDMFGIRKNRNENSRLKKRYAHLLKGKYKNKFESILNVYRIGRNKAIQNSHRYLVAMSSAGRALVKNGSTAMEIARFKVDRRAKELNHKKKHSENLLRLKADRNKSIEALNGQYQMERQFNLQELVARKKKEKIAKEKLVKERAVAEAVALELAQIKKQAKSESDKRNMERAVAEAVALQMGQIKKEAEDKEEEVEKDKDERIGEWSQVYPGDRGLLPPPSRPEGPLPTFGGRISDEWKRYYTYLEKKRKWKERMANVEQIGMTFEQHKRNVAEAEVIGTGEVTEAEVEQEVAKQEVEKEVKKQDEEKKEKSNKNIYFIAGGGLLLAIILIIVLIKKK